MRKGVRFLVFQLPALANIPFLSAVPGLVYGRMTGTHLAMNIWQNTPMLYQRSM